MIGDSIDLGILHKGNEASHMLASWLVSFINQGSSNLRFGLQCVCALELPGVRNDFAIAVVYSRILFGTYMQ